MNENKQEGAGFDFEVVLNEIERKCAEMGIDINADRQAGVRHDAGCHDCPPGYRGPEATYADKSEPGLLDADGPMAGALIGWLQDQGAKLGGDAQETLGEFTAFLGLGLKLGDRYSKLKSKQRRAWVLAELYGLHFQARDLARKINAQIVQISGKGPGCGNPNGCHAYDRRDAPQAPPPPPPCKTLDYLKEISGEGGGIGNVEQLLAVRRIWAADMLEVGFVSHPSFKMRESHVEAAIAGFLSSDPGVLGEQFAWTFGLHVFSDASLLAVFHKAVVDATGTIDTAREVKLSVTPGGPAKMRLEITGRVCQAQISHLQFTVNKALEEARGAGAEGSLLLYPAGFLVSPS